MNLISNANPTVLEFHQFAQVRPRSNKALKSMVAPSQRKTREVLLKILVQADSRGKSGIR